MTVCFFLPETAIFVFYIFAALLMSSSSGTTETHGWYLLLFIHLIMTAKIGLDVFAHGAEIYLTLLFSCMVFVLVSIFMTVIMIRRARPADYVEGAVQSPIRGEVRKQLNRTRRLVLSDVALLAILIFFSQVWLRWPNAVPHLFPVYSEAFRMSSAANAGVIYRWKWITLRDYGWLSGFLLPWMAGGGVFAALGLSSYLVYWTRKVLMRL